MEKQWQDIAEAPKDGTTVWLWVETTAGSGGGWASPAMWSTWDRCWRLLMGGEKVSYPVMQPPRLWCAFDVTPPNPA